MSWVGIKKAINRGTTSLMQTAGAVDKTHDTAFEQEERRIKSLETVIDNLQKSSGSYLNKLRSTILSQSRLAASLLELGDDTIARQSVQAFHSCTLRVDDTIKNEHDEGLRATVVNPIQAYHLHFGDINGLMKRRSKKLLDYDSARSKVKSKVDKPSADPTLVPQLEQQVASTKKSYDMINDRLKAELPQFTSLRISYLDPSFTSLVSWQYLLGTTAAHHFNATKSAVIPGELMNHPQGGTEAEWDQTLRELDVSLEGVMEDAVVQIRQLSICNVSSS